MKYLIIGLGIYGANLARDLASQGNEVIGADIKRQRVDDIKDAISTAYCLDSTDPAALSVLPLNNVDVVIVAIGENFGASVKTVALLKQNKVKAIYARAIDNLHHAILESFKVDKILLPEQRAASELAIEMMVGGSVSVMPIASDRMVVQMRLPEYFAGRTYAYLRNEKDFDIIAAAREVKSTSIIGIASVELQPLSLDTDTAQSGDMVTLVTTRRTLQALMRRTS